MKHLIKNIIITVLAAWLSFFLLGGGHGMATLVQLGIPVFIIVLGTVAAYTCYDSNKGAE